MTAMAYSMQLPKKGFEVPRPPAKADPAYVRYPVWVKDPEVTKRVATRHATLGTWFSSVLEESISPACGDYEMGSCPRAEEAARHLINLPTNPRVSAQDIEAILSAVARAETMAKNQIS